jgi:hypothetical protein
LGPGFEPSCVSNASEPGSTAICGSGSTAVTVSCTATLCGEFGALPLTVIEPSYVPAARLELATLTCTLFDAPEASEPEVVFKLSQLALSEALQLSVPPPEFWTVKLLFEGLDPSDTSKLREPGLSAICGSGSTAVTVSCTETVTGAFVALPSTVMVAL